MGDARLDDGSGKLGLMEDCIISKKLQILDELCAVSIAPIEGWTSRNAVHDGPGRYSYDSRWARTSVPCSFAAGQTAFLKTRVSIPDSVTLRRAYLQFDFEMMEGLLAVDGEPYCGLDANHRRVLVPGKSDYELAIEFASVPDVISNSALRFKRGLFKGGCICVVDRKVEAFCLQARFAWETSRVAGDERTVRLLGEAVEAALLAVDLTLPRRQFLAEVGKAAGILKDRLAAIDSGAANGRVFATGHTHIDTAWLWPLKETIRKCSRTFATACRLMERYPNYYFACSQPQLYQYTRQHFPSLYKQIKKRVREGRWETTGAMWVETDCNVPSGESLIRQVLYGLDFFKTEFGTRPRNCWLPDVFGYPASLPEILRGCGLDSFFSTKIHGPPFPRNDFPHHLFRWRGLDGTEILAHLPKLKYDYVGAPDPEQLTIAWNQYTQKAEYPEVLFPFGHGDGGGGVAEVQLDMLKLAEDGFPGLPAVRTGPSEQYFDELAAADPDLPVWDGELYLEGHRGTYTTHSQLKRANRASELLLREAEIFGSIANCSGRGKGFDATALRKAWELVLLHQFHDILPGSSIGMVYAESLRDHAAAQRTARKELDNSLGRITPGKASGRNPDALCVFNSLSWPRADVCTATVPDTKTPTCLTGPDGSVCPVQLISRDAGRATIVFQPGKVPSMGHAVLRFGAAAGAPGSTLDVSGKRLENAYFRIDLTPRGGIARLFDKRHKRDVLVSGQVGNDLQLLQDGPEHEDAWNVHASADKRRYPIAGRASVTVLEAGPVRGVVRVERTHRDTVISQDIVIYAELPRIDFVTRVDWQERQTMLKVAFPLEIRATQATCEVQFGAVARPTHRNTSWDEEKFEVPCQRWVDLSEAGYGVSLLNDCKYGCDFLGNVMRLTLLRGTTWPDPEADRGHHEFTYSLLPHAGDWCEGETVRRAWELNVPARAVPIQCPESGRLEGSFLSLTGAAAVVEAFKPAEDGRGFILRVYEPHGGRGQVTVNLDMAVSKVFACNLVEEDGPAIPIRKANFRFDLDPFQIRAFRLLGG
ncbi:MAG: alpha-mannosidase [Lentisphaeria bacterium]|jgi:alpha-mannosidase|nr:alpha-mannosidase [Lentisphaeria bacterium]